MSAAKHTAVLTLMEYAAGEATYESDHGDVRLVLPLADWDAIGRPADVRVTVEADE